MKKRKRRRCGHRRDPARWHNEDADLSHPDSGRFGWAPGRWDCLRATGSPCDRSLRAAASGSGPGPRDGARAGAAAGRERQGARALGGSGQCRITICSGAADDGWRDRAGSGGDVVLPARRTTHPGSSRIRTRSDHWRLTSGHWPLDETGYITRGQVKAGGRDEAHPGIDIAVRSATWSGPPAEPRSTGRRGSGIRLLRPARSPGGIPDHVRPPFAHLSDTWNTVAAGEVIGLSGNSGRSTAPHLHFEIRQRGSRWTH